MKPAYTLVEVLIASVVLAIGALAVLQGLGFLGQLNRHSYEIQWHQQHLKVQAETLRALVSHPRDSVWELSQNGERWIYRLNVLDTAEILQLSAAQQLSEQARLSLLYRPPEALLELHIQAEGQTVPVLIQKLLFVWPQRSPEPQGVQ
jgi:prepilin-type N-terminal cleavage/methylation domain-containing protein